MKWLAKCVGLLCKTWIKVNVIICDLYIDIYSTENSTTMIYFMFYFINFIVFGNYLSIICSLEVMVLTVFICWLGCQLDYAKTTEQIAIKLGTRPGVSPEQAPFTFGVDLDKGTDPGIFPHFLLSYFFFPNFSGNNTWISMNIDTFRWLDSMSENNLMGIK